MHWLAGQNMALDTKSGEGEARVASPYTLGSLLTRDQVMRLYGLIDGVSTMDHGIKCCTPETEVLVELFNTLTEHDDEEAHGAAERLCEAAGRLLRHYEGRLHA